MPLFSIQSSFCSAQLLRTQQDDTRKQKCALWLSSVMAKRVEKGERNLFFLQQGGQDIVKRASIPQGDGYSIPTWGWVLASLQDDRHSISVR